VSATPVLPPSRTGFVWHELYMWHDTGSGAGPNQSGGRVEPDEHGESPASKRRLKNLLEVSGLLDALVPVRPREATAAELERFHTSDYVERIRQLSAAGGGDAGDHTPFAGGGYEIAALSAGGCIAAVEAVLAGDVRNAYALVRPPGHHAERDRGRGFCIFGNVAVAALHAREALGLERVAIVDWDVHWGNGNQQAFWEDPSVLTISLHQDDRWPRNGGKLGERGAGAGEGFNVNVPLPPGTGRGGYLAAIDRVVVPALERFRPQLVLVSCGFDASSLDPFGRMMLTSSDFGEMTARLAACAEVVCDGRLVLCHEGGYSTAYVPFCGLATIEALSCVRSPVEDPFLERYAGVAYSDLQPAQDDVIEQAADMAAALESAART
jgi:acetoin utilization deacetylase AcuC-like enzyme